MGIRTRITAMAKQRGWTAAEVARQLGMYRSNLSAMDAGRRTVSLRTLGRLARLLGCHPGELLTIEDDPAPGIFRNAHLTRQLEARERHVTEGAERGWVHTTQLAWQRHYARRRSRPSRS